MSIKLHVKKGDTVYVLTGKNRAATGKVLRTIPEKSRVLVEGVNLVKKHKKPQRNNPGGIITQEAPIHISNVMLVCNKCGAPARVGRRLLENGDKVRYCKRCKENIDTIVNKAKES
ncbi:MAG: 50S ribosomal protein L24 [Clostridiales bacterium]|jgi:large subunit ribosomal protein L24|nr:50S ribosomal protein L24 [Clostridiales bacterium]